MGLALGLASSLVWGTADFLGGVYTRRLTLASVTVGSQIAGLLALLVAAASHRRLGRAADRDRARSGRLRRDRALGVLPRPSPPARSASSRP